MNAMGTYFSDLFFRLRNGSDIYVVWLEAETLFIKRNGKEIICEPLDIFTEVTFWEGPGLVTEIEALELSDGENKKIVLDDYMEGFMDVAGYIAANFCGKAYGDIYQQIHAGKILSFKI